MPGDVIVTARDLDGADRRIGAEFSGYHSRAAVVQFRSGVGASVVEIVIASGLGELGRPIDLDRHWRRGRRWPDRAVVVEVLAEDGLKRLQCGAVTCNWSGQVG